MSLNFLIVHFLHLETAIAAPIANLTALRTEIAPAWVADPSGRGTWSLLYSCLFTLLLCVYTAIHLNVPSPVETKLKFWLRQVKWVVIAVLAPEIVVYTAFEQWVHARRFLIKLRSIAAKNEDKDFKRWYNDGGATGRFDMVYAFYAVMGGFAADFENMHNVLKRVTITPAGILFLAKEGKFCRVNRNDIDDKSKANILAKSLVCVQVLWVAGQAIERKIAGYPVTLLEVHTLVHVACALIMYGLWFMKPLNVQDPTVIEFKDDGRVLAFMLQLSLSHLGTDPRFAGYNCHRSGVVSRGEPEMIFFNFQDPVCINIDTSIGISVSDLEKIKQRPKIFPFTVPESGDAVSDQIHVSSYVSLSDNTLQETNGRYPVGIVDSEYTPASNEEVICKLVAGQVVFSRIGPRLQNYDWKSRTQNGHTHRYNFYPPFLSCPLDPIDMVSLSRKDLTRLKLATEWILMLQARPRDDHNSNRYECFESHHKTISLISIRRVVMENEDLFRHEIDLTQRASNLHGKLATAIGSDSAYLLAAMTIIPAAYGCAHLGALNILFPTPTERLLWKFASIFLIAVAGGSGVIALAIYIDEVMRDALAALMNKSRASVITPHRYLLKIFLKLYDWATDWIGYDGRKTLENIWAFSLLYIPLALTALVYLSSRLYLVVESFISLRHVPIGVYQTPKGNFMSYIPHL